MPLGLMDCAFTEVQIEMCANSRLLLYTDGVTESMNASLEEYGPSRVRDHFLHLPATAQSLLGDIRNFTSGQPSTDDVTIVTIAAKSNSVHDAY